MRRFIELKTKEKRFCRQPDVKTVHLHLLVYILFVLISKITLIKAKFYFTLSYFFCSIFAHMISVRTKKISKWLFD